MTETLATSSIKLRPQPVGIFGPPASFLLLPNSGEQSAAALMKGDASATLRADWRFYQLALEGRIADAQRAISGDDFLAHYNRFVLQPDAQAYEALRRDASQDMLPLVHAAAFVSGVIETPPPADGLTGELRALVLLTAASYYMERDESPEAIRLLEEARVCAQNESPLLTAQILHQMAALEKAATPAQAIVHYKEAIRLAADTPLISLRAELWLNLGITLQEMAQGRRGPLLEAAKAYQEAIRCGLSAENLPELYAMAQSNLALAYLTMPAQDASDQLRMGIAVQGLREALKVFRRDTHPEMWSSAQLNLANALQYLPSSHPEENLQQAVNIYEELLEVRNKALDPLGYARLLANQANALAHLGIFQPAIEKLNEAYKLFHWHGEPDMAASALELVNEVNRKIEEAKGQSGTV